MIHFWSFMCWLDEVLHTLDRYGQWFWLTDSEARYRFCQWVHRGYIEAEDAAKGEQS